MKKIENKIMLITYADSMSRDLKELDEILAGHFRGIIGGLHVLPFYPSSGDRGFAVINYDIVDPAFGTWDDIDRLADQYYMMADFMLNHVSIRSEEFKDYMKNGDASPYRDMFIHWEEFWPGGEPTEEQYDMLYRRKQTYPYIEFTRDDGEKVHLWNTFFQEQIDIDPYSEATQDYYERNLGILRSHVPLVRFDAFAYATKRPGTNCFFVEPDVWNVLDIGMEPLRKTGTEMLPEIHENYHIQLKMAEKGYWVYDFALPMLLLHGLKTGRTDRLIHWLNICPRKQFTTLDTHDGIGVVDVAGLLTEDEIDIVRDDVNEISGEMFNYIKLPSMIKAAWLHLLLRSPLRRQRLSARQGRPVLHAGHPAGLLRGASRRGERHGESEGRAGSEKYQPAHLHKGGAGRSRTETGVPAPVRTDALPQLLRCFQRRYHSRRRPAGRNPSHHLEEG